MFYHPSHPIQISETNTIENLSSNILHNRLNFRWYATDNLTIAIEARNRIFSGQIVKQYPGYKNIIDYDNGFFDLSKNVINGNGWFLHSSIDRLSLDYTFGKWQVKAGRQRINWGINLVWNPNDIFNTFSYFDFDYEERPGTDALKIQYYVNETSAAEVVYKPGKGLLKQAIAARYKFSEFNYDFQLLGGTAGDDYFVGGGWAGDIKGGGFRGELSWFIPRNEYTESAEAFVASISADYTLKNSLYFHAGTLFNSHGLKGKAGGRDFFNPDISVKMLSLAMFNIFSQVSYPFHPLISGNMSVIINPWDKSLFLGPSFTCSLSNNLELFMNGQIFTGSDGSEFGDFGQAVFGRLKWSF